MNKTTTQDLLFYAYNESDLKNSDRIQRGIDGDPLVQNEFSEIIDVLFLLDQGKVQPGEESLKKILQYAGS